MSRSKVLGQALYRLRKKADLTQVQAADSLGVTQVTWARYEKGERDVLLNEVLQDRISAALGFSREDLLAEAEALEAGQPIFDAPSRAVINRESYKTKQTPALAGVDFMALSGADMRSFEIVNEEVAPYAEAGVTVLYDLKKRPRKNQGALIRMRNGELRPRIYLRTSPSHIECLKYVGRTVEGATVYSEVAEYIALSEQEGVYPILARLTL